MSELPGGTTLLDVAVVVVTYNSKDIVADLLDSLDAGLAGCTWSVVVADNDSADGTVELVRSLAPAARVVEMGDNAGYAAGINAALAVCDPASAVLILNPDVRLSAGSVGVMLGCLRRSGAGIVVPRLVDAGGNLAHSLRREPNIRRSLADAVFGPLSSRWLDAFSEEVSDPNAYRHETRADWASGPVLLISGECLSACGPWDESFFLYSEETEYCLRARDRGFLTVLTPDAEVVHLGGESKVSPKLQSLLVVNRLRLYARHHSPALTAVFWLTSVFREASRAVFGRPASREALLTLLSPRRARAAAVRAGGREVTP